MCFPQCTKRMLNHASAARGRRRDENAKQMLDKVCTLLPGAFVEWFLGAGRQNQQTLAKIWPTLAQIGPILDTIGQSWPNSWHK